MLSFEIIESGKAIQICADDEGLSLLQKELETARTAGHIHLLSRSNGGNQIDEANPWGAPAIGEVIVTVS